ncbi:MAG: insulinase family protein [Bacteroidetes bacterium]|nr:insulinase family protein [Bacteroidota bacterium]
MDKPGIYYLKNGLCVLHLFHKESQVVHCGILLKAGTRDEPAGKEGLAHFIEHSLFKGTEKRKSFHILNRLEVVGGELNAYTTKEETCVHASVMNRHFERALELISDIVFHSVYPPKEVEKEKEVIIDEIRSYQDTPYEQIFDDFEGQLFKGHPLGHPILGTEESVRNFNRKDLVNYTRSHYNPSSMVFAVSGNIEEKKLLALAEQYFGEYKGQKSSTNRISFKKYKPESIIQERAVNQVHYMMGRPAFGLKDPRRFSLVLFNNILGGPGMNSRLNLNVREKYGFTYTIESGYHTYTDSGIFHVYFATDSKHFNKTRELVEKELRKICKEKITPSRFRQYKEQMIGQIELVQENRLSVMLSLAKSQLNLGKVFTLEEIKKRFSDMQPRDIQEVANEILEPSYRSELIYQPK